MQKYFQACAAPDTHKYFQVPHGRYFDSTMKLIGSTMKFCFFKARHKLIDSTLKLIGSTMKLIGSTMKLVRTYVAERPSP